MNHSNYFKPKKDKPEAKIVKQSPKPTTVGGLTDDQKDRIKNYWTKSGMSTLNLKQN